MSRAQVKDLTVSLVGLFDLWLIRVMSFRLRHAVLGICLLFSLAIMTALHAEESRKRKPLPAAEEIAKLPKDGGPKYNRLVFEKSDPAGAYYVKSNGDVAVQNLEVDHLIVLGHAHCGGIRSMFEEREDGADDSQFVVPWMSLVRSAYLRVQGTMPDASIEEKARVCEQSAVLVSLENLMTFPPIRDRVSDGRLRLHGWYIDIRSCGLHIYDPVQQHFEAVG